jgi:hypothetical protein
MSTDRAEYEVWRAERERWSVKKDRYKDLIKSLERVIRGQRKQLKQHAGTSNRELRWRVAEATQRVAELEREIEMLRNTDQYELGLQHGRLLQRTVERLNSPSSES